MKLIHTYSELNWYGRSVSKTVLFKGHINTPFCLYLPLIQQLTNWLTLITESECSTRQILKPATGSIYIQSLYPIAWRPVFLFCHQSKHSSRGFLINILYVFLVCLCPCHCNTLHFTVLTILGDAYMPISWRSYYDRSVMTIFT